RRFCHVHGRNGLIFQMENAAIECIRAQALAENHPKILPQDLLKIKPLKKPLCGLLMHPVNSFKIRQSSRFHPPNILM
ncbi:hypothetical protein RUM43_008155, partial [Polyplax serrata]